MQYIENRTFDEINIGDTAEISRTLKAEDISLFAVTSGDVNPVHLDKEYANASRFHEVIAHGMWGGALISAVLGTELPGPGTIYVNQSLRFKKPVGVGDTITAKVKVARKIVETKHIILDCECLDQGGDSVISGEAEVIAPVQKVRRPRAVLPEVHLHERGARFRAILKATGPLPAIRTAVVHPCDELSLRGALEARARGLIVPLLVGPADKIKRAAGAAQVELDGVELVDAPHSHAAAERAVALVRAGRADALMKGALHTDEVMAAALHPSDGLRTERRMSHIFGFDVPTYPKPLMITDAAINIAPNLEVKKDIVQNAIDLARAIGVETPKVAVLSAVETVTSKLQSTLDAAALCKMADRGQIRGGVIDGPLAFDNAINRQAALTKGIDSPVAGDPDILVAPNLEAGNMIAKQLTYLAGADSAGIVLGARAPILLTSRADNVASRLASAALALLYVRWREGAAK
jgi:phosphotransacetylase/acyl dehydratase